MILKLNDCPAGCVMLQRDLAVPEGPRRWYEKELMKMAQVHALAAVGDREKIVFVDVNVTVRLTTAVHLDDVVGAEIPLQPPVRPVETQAGD
jgi:hypothetical protein